jgi:predicted ATP-binding protein involved in virulence
MQISKIVIKNFRGFELKEFYLDPFFTVAIGDNGAGKSTLLQAAQVAAGAFFLGLPYVNRRHIHEDEIRTSFNETSRQWIHHTPTKIVASGIINGSEQFTWRREIPKYGQSTSSKIADVGVIKTIAENYVKSINQVDRPLLPVIAYFGIKQLGGSVFKRKKTKTKKVIIRDGYYNALGSKSDEASYIAWFYYYENNLQGGMEFEGTYEAFIEAIEKAIPYLSNVTFDRIQLQLVADCEIPGQEKRRLPQQMMSDGVKRVLGIVADIAYRCVTLNGFQGRNAIRGSNGVVMIDELDMHLHPKWQRHIVSNLKDAFPNIQFITTTHSLFIIQSLNSHELINLDVQTDVSPDELKIDDVATGIMGVDSLYSVKNEEAYQRSKEIISLIETASPAEIEHKIQDIADPGLRAFLELNKMSKGK